MFWHLLTNRWNRGTKSGTLGFSLAKPFRKPLTLELLEDRTTPAAVAPLFEAPLFGGSGLEGKIFPRTPLAPVSITFLDQDLLDRVPLAELTDSRVVVIRPTGDPLLQIGKALSGETGIETVRIISHGKAGALLLGGSVVDEAALQSQDSQVSDWGRALASDADILLYGCSVASTPAGRGLVDSLARLTGADVAASSDPTGAGGDLILEYAKGLVATTPGATQQAWEESGLQLPSEGGFTYEIINGKATITKYTGPGGAVTVPGTLGGKPVTAIGDLAFYLKASITSITLPNSLTTIGGYSFDGCSGLTSITLPASLTSIGAAAFSGCGKLTNIFALGNAPSLGFGVFAGVSVSAKLYYLPGTTGWPNPWGGLATVPLFTTSSNNFFNTTITGYNGPGGAVTVPGTLGGKSVTAVGYGAFQNKASITSINLPNNLNSIGDNAFSDCSSLTSITLPASLTSIGGSAFYGCSSLKSITLPASANLTTIGNYAFTYCNGLTSITLPNKVTTIGDSAFRWCSGLKSILLPASLTKIGDDAFFSCSKLTDIGVGANNQTFSSVSGILYNKFQTALLICPNAKQGAITTLPSTVTSIGDNAFFGCSGLTSIILPNSLTTLGNGAFYYCSKLTSIILPNSLTTLGNGAFSYCSGLTSITLPNTLTSIGGYAFYDCDSLTSITLANKVTTVGEYAFAGCSGLTSITLPASLTTIGDFAFSVCSGLTSITLPNSLTTIGERAFSYCSGLKSILLPASASLTTIGDKSFFGCSDLKSILLPASLTTIGKEAFFGCSKLTDIGVGANNQTFSSVSGILYNKFQTTLLICPNGKQGAITTLPSTVTSIGTYAFYGCSGLTSITLPNKVTTIGTYAFDGCSKLTGIGVGADNQTFSSVSGILYNKSQTTLLICPNGKQGAITTLPSTVTSIGDGAFFGCSGLTSITLPASLTTLGSGAFFGCSGLTSITLPNSLTTLGTGAFFGCSGLKSILLPASANLTTIGNYAFKGCSSLKSILLPASLTTIGDEAFKDCSGLTSIFALGNAPSIGADPFFNVTSKLTYFTGTTGWTNPWGGLVTEAISKEKWSLIPLNSIPILTTTNGAANGISIWGSGGKKLGTLNPYPGFTGRIVTALGDLNGDGVPDIITGVGPGAAPLLRTYDGRTLTEMGTAYFAYDQNFLGGMSVAAADVDGDGYCEVITGTGNGSSPHVRVRKADGTSMASFFAYGENFKKGVNLITGDIDGDGKSEIVTTPNAGGGPHVKVFDGAGNASASFFAYESTFTGGFSLALADTDGNGTKEIVTLSYAGRKTAGRVFGPDYLKFKEWLPNGEVTSGGIVVAGDLNGDKVDEIVTVPLLGTAGTLKVFDGGLKLVASVSPYAVNFTGGISIKVVDTDGDGTREIVTAPGKGASPLVKRWNGTLTNLDSLYATAIVFTGGIWLD